MKKLYTNLVLTVCTALTLTSTVSAQCTATTMCPQLTTNAGSVRGYYFVAPVSFTLCGLFIPTDADTGAQSIEVIRFNGVMPPAYPAVTNSFTSLFYTANNSSATMIP